MGVVATAWFWKSVSQVAGWKLLALVQPILLPTSMSLAILLFLRILPSSFPVGIHAGIFASCYGIALSVFSQGRIPHDLIVMIRQIFGLQKAPHHLPKAEENINV
jgi:hypothetical protein